MHGCGLRIGQALAVNLRCRINRGKTCASGVQVSRPGLPIVRAFQAAQGHARDRLRRRKRPV
jgi:hypothetical protein